MRINIDITDNMSFLCVKINENIYDDYFKVNKVYSLEEINYAIKNTSKDDLFVYESDDSSVKKQYGGATLSINRESDAEEIITFAPTGITQELIWHDINEQLMMHS